MADQTQSQTNSGTVSPLGQAIGRIPSGVYILTARHAAQATGMLASWVQQAGFEPPMLTVAVARQRFVGDWIVSTRRFTLNQVGAGGKAFLRHFARGFSPDADAFEGLTLREESAAAPVIDGMMAYLDCELVSELSEGDHRIFLARIVGGAVLDPNADPMVHIRNSGLHY